VECKNCTSMLIDFSYLVFLNSLSAFTHHTGGLKVFFLIDSDTNKDNTPFLLHPTFLTFYKA
jgi:hypothetical protein